MDVYHQTCCPSSNVKMRSSFRESLATSQYSRSAGTALNVSVGPSADCSPAETQPLSQTNSCIAAPSPSGSAAGLPRRARTVRRGRWRRGAKR